MPSDTNDAVRPRPEVTDLPVYNAGISVAAARQISGREDIVALASNENPYGPSPAVARALSLLQPARYSDSASGLLRQALADKLGAAPDCIVCGNGSEELLAAISRAYLVKGDIALTVSPTFGLHEIEPRAAGAQVVKVPMTAAFAFDVDALVAELARAPKLAFIASPSNPVGPALSRTELARLAAALRPQTLFVLDEAYFELADPDAPDGLALLRERPDLSWIVLRTFSKAYGLAGLRVGYGVSAHGGIASAIRACLTPFNVNAAAQAAAVAALGDEAWMRETTGRIRHDRAVLAARLQAMGLRVVPSQTNFLFIDLATNAAAVAQALLRQGIVVKPWLEPGYSDFLRVSIGTAQDNERFARALEQVLGGS